jgi:hypothetical protein
VQDRKKEQQALYAQKKKFLKKQVRKWQRKQPYRAEDRTGNHRELFNRLSFMMPTRKRLEIGTDAPVSLSDESLIDVVTDSESPCRELAREPKKDSRFSRALLQVS